MGSNEGIFVARKQPCPHDLKTSVDMACHAAPMPCHPDLFTRVRRSRQAKMHYMRQQPSAIARQFGERIRKCLENHVSWLQVMPGRTSSFVPWQNWQPKFHGGRLPHLDSICARMVGKVTLRDNLTSNENSANRIKFINAMYLFPFEILALILSWGYTLEISPTIVAYTT